MRPTLVIGLHSALEYRVTLDRTVPHLLPEAPQFRTMPPVFATGYLVAIAEWACLVTIEGHLDEGELTLGTHIHLSHEAPTTPGALLRVTAGLTEIEGRRLAFEVRVTQGSTVVSVGTHHRAVVDAARFRARAGLKDHPFDGDANVADK